MKEFQEDIYRGLQEYSQLKHMFNRSGGCMKERFIEMCNDIYHRGMLDFESTCEEIIAGISR